MATLTAMGVGSMEATTAYVQTVTGVGSTTCGVNDPTVVLDRIRLLLSLVSAEGGGGGGGAGGAERGPGRGPLQARAGLPRRRPAPPRPTPPPAVRAGALLHLSCICPAFLACFCPIHAVSTISRPLAQLLPSNAAELANRNARLHVWASNVDPAVASVLPPVPRAHDLYPYTSKADVVESVIASSFASCYLAPTVADVFRERAWIDAAFATSMDYVCDSMGASRDACVKVIAVNVGPGSPNSSYVGCPPAYGTVAPNTGPLYPLLPLANWTLPLNCSVYNPSYDMPYVIPDATPDTICPGWCGRGSVGLGALRMGGRLGEGNRPSFLGAEERDVVLFPDTSSCLAPPRPVARGHTPPRPAWPRPVLCLPGQARPAALRPAAPRPAAPRLGHHAPHLAHHPLPPPCFTRSRTHIPYTQCVWARFAAFEFGSNATECLSTVLDVVRIGYAEGAAWAKEKGFSKRGRV